MGCVVCRARSVIDLVYGGEDVVECSPCGRGDVSRAARVEKWFRSLGGVVDCSSVPGDAVPVSVHRVGDREWMLLVPGGLRPPPWTPGRVYVVEDGVCYEVPADSKTWVRALRRIIRVLRVEADEGGGAP